jgi:hypothetical protein
MKSDHTDINTKHYTILVLGPHFKQRKQTLNLKVVRVPINQDYWSHLWLIFDLSLFVNNNSKRTLSIGPFVGTTTFFMWEPSIVTSV